MKAITPDYTLLDDSLADLPKEELVKLITCIPEAMYVFGQRFLYGYYDQLDDERKAWTWIERAARAGHPAALAACHFAETATWERISREDAETMLRECKQRRHRLATLYLARVYNNEGRDQLAIEMCQDLTGTLRISQLSGVLLLVSCITSFIECQVHSVKEYCLRAAVKKLKSIEAMMLYWSYRADFQDLKVDSASQAWRCLHMALIRGNKDALAEVRQHLHYKDKQLFLSLCTVILTPGTAVTVSLNADEKRIFEDLERYQKKSFNAESVRWLASLQDMERVVLLKWIPEAKRLISEAENPAKRQRVCEE